MQKYFFIYESPYTYSTLGGVGVVVWWCGGVIDRLLSSTLQLLVRHLLLRDAVRLCLTLDRFRS